MSSSSRPAAVILVLVAVVVLAAFFVWTADRGSRVGSGIRARDGHGLTLPYERPTLQGAQGAGARSSGTASAATAPAPLKGCVVDAESGAPIPGARYFLWPRYEDPPEDPLGGFRHQPAVEGALPAHHRVLYEADVRGRFAFSGGFAGVARGRPLDLHVFADGYVGRIVPVRTPGAVDVALVRGRTLRGWVLDADGRGLPGAWVRAWRVIPFNPGRDTWLLVAWSTSDSEGAFSLHADATEAVFLQAESPSGRRSVHAFVAPESEDPVELRVGPNVRVALDVRTLDGGEMPSAHLSAYVPELWRLGRPWQPALWRTGWAEAPPTRRTVYEVPLPPGPLPETLNLYVPGFVVQEIPLDPAIREQTHSVRLVRAHPTGTLRLRFAWPRDVADPEPILVRVKNDPHGSGHYAHVHARYVVAAGARELVAGPLVAGHYRLEGVGETVARFSRDVTVLEDEERVVDVDLTAGGTVELTVEDPPPTGIRFFFVWIEEHDGKLLSCVVDGLQRADGWRSVWEEEEPYEGMRWSNDFVAVPDGTGRAVARVHGLVPRRYRLCLQAGDEEGHTDPHVEVRAAESTRVRIPPSK